jgi:outer membrane protein
VVHIHRLRPALAIAATAAFGFFATTVAEAQQAPATLTLQEAIALARRHNPDFLTQQNDEVEAHWAVRESYGALLPSASVSGTMSYQAAGVDRVGTLFSNESGTGYLSSNYSVGMNYRLSAETVLRHRVERTNRRATTSRVEAADFTLTAEVSRQYLAALRAAEGVTLAQQELERAGENLRLAEARVAVGSAIALEAKQAGVEHGRAEVELLRAENLEQTELLRLAQLLGVEFNREVQLTTEFPVAEPHWSKEALTTTAMGRHPQLRSLRATSEASEATARLAKGQYLPTLDFSAGWRGYAQQATNSDYLIANAQGRLAKEHQSCLAENEIRTRLTDPIPLDCSPAQFQLTDQMRGQILDQNSVFPFNFTRQPFGASVTISLPLFNGFSRERRLSSARVAAENARHTLRREELRIKTDVATLHQSLVTAYRAVTLEARNKELAADQRLLARERYSVGAISFVELLDAETMRARADRAYLDAVYAYHQSLAALEAAVGQPLNTLEEERQ